MKIYLINGNSHLLITEKINEIIQNSNNVVTFDMNINTIEDVIVEAGYFSMFNELKYIVIRNANFFGNSKLADKEQKMLENYLDKPSDLAVLIFICNENLDMRKKLTKIIKSKYDLIAIAPLKEYEIINKVKKYFQDNGKVINDESIKYIVNNSLNNYDIVMNEVNKIMLYYQSENTIKPSDIVNIVSKSLNTNNFLFVDAVVENNLEGSLKLLNDLKIMKVEPSILISLLARDFRIMLNVKTLLEAKKQEYRIMQELGLADWQLNKYLKKAFPYKKKELEKILQKLADLDLNIKRGKIERYMALELFVLDICE